MVLFTRDTISVFVVRHSDKFDNLLRYEHMMIGL